jgi:predicted nucleic acid-binding Zn ribbon protein
MARHRPEPEDDFDDDELPDGVYHDDEPALVKCPHCGEEVYEEAQYCPKCENFISVESRASDAKPMWIWVCLILALLASLFAAFL